MRSNEISRTCRTCHTAKSILPYGKNIFSVRQFFFCCTVVTVQKKYFCRMKTGKANVQQDDFSNGKSGFFLVCALLWTWNSVLCKRRLTPWLLNHPHGSRPHNYSCIVRRLRPGSSSAAHKQTCNAVGQGRAPRGASGCITYAPYAS